MTDSEAGAGGERAAETEPAAESAALVGATGGAGTTRLTVEVGGALAGAGNRVAAFDAALGTQGMANYVEGRVDPGVTDLLTDDEVTPATAMVESPVAGGELHLCPARATFDALARAKTPEAARRFETALRGATEAFDYVLVDVPPLASNPAVAATTTADRVGVVAPPTPRGADAVQQIRGRLVDVGTGADVVVANRGDHAGLEASVVVPDGPGSPATAPVADDGDGEFPTAVARLAEELFGVDLDRAAESEGVLGRLGP